MTHSGQNKIEARFIKQNNYLGSEAIRVKGETMQMTELKILT
jgi:hypothetical protein